MTVYLVRHADAGDRDTWIGDDALRPLSEKGWRQARGLAKVLAGAGIERISSSPYLRCGQTVEPLAEAQMRPIERDPRLAEGASWREALLMIGRVESNEVMCSQGDIIAGIVDELVRDGVILTRDARWQKASTWALTTRAGRVKSARYLPPPRT